MIQPGRVERVDRANKVVEIAPIGTTGRVRARFPQPKRPPAPLSGVMVEQVHGGQWLVRETPAQRELFLEDEFLGLFEDGTGNMWSGIYWGVVGGQVYHVGNGGWSDGNGVIAIYDDGGTASGYLSQGGATASLASGYGYWMSARAASYTSAQASSFYFTNDAFSDFAAVVVDSAASPDAYIFTPGGSQAIPFNAGGLQSPYIVDIVIIPGVIACGWIDGDGPYSVTSGVPAVGVGLKPHIQIDDAGSGSFRETYIDWVQVERFSDPFRPELLETHQLQPTSQVGHSYMGLPT